MKLETPHPDVLQTRIQGCHDAIATWGKSATPETQQVLRDTLSFYEDAARFRKLDRAFSLIVLKKVDGSKLVTISVQWNQDSTDLEATTGETLLDAVDKLKGSQV